MNNIIVNMSLGVNMRLYFKVFEHTCSNTWWTHHFLLVRVFGSSVTKNHRAKRDKSLLC